jgi:hypothetical protein
MAHSPDSQRFDESSSPVVVEPPEASRIAGDAFSMPKDGLFFLLLFAFLLVARMAHVSILWVDEAYGMAGAQAMLRGMELYTDVWFDKPPLYAWVYLLEGGLSAWPLRLLNVAFGLLCCWLAWGAAGALFGRWEARAAALLMAFFLVFSLPAAIVSLAPDMLTIPFALGMAWLAARRCPLLAGAVAGAALLANAKALFLAPVVLVWLLPYWRQVAIGYAAAAAAGPLLLMLQGSLGAYWQQVWVWGAAYSRDTHLDAPLAEGLLRTANWMGFHVALIVGAFVYFLRRPDRHAGPLAVWFLLALASVAGGWRFFPRYYLAVLPVAVVIAAHGLRLIPPRLRIALLVVVLAVPVLRFGTPQVQIALASLTGQAVPHRDLALYASARDVAAWLNQHASTEDTLLVWGFRPELNALSRLAPGTPFLDSQPLTGVIADRHLVSDVATFPDLAATNRQLLRTTSPTWIADGLGLLNESLGIGKYEDLQPWFSHYEEVNRLDGWVVYKRRADDSSQ